jgi:outer membrane protein OmpA-like peptidoglycan-associated protein
VSLVALVSLSLAGCVIQDPPALGEIAKARKALDDAKKAGAADRVPDKFAELEKRYLQARGVFYACNDAEAARLAQALVADANALLGAPMPPPPMANRPPVARLSVPACAVVGDSVSMDASGSSDPDGDTLSYVWDFGDGTAPAQMTFPRTTHVYSRANNYTVKVTADDGRGGMSSATAPLTVVQKFVLTDRGRKVLFDFDKYNLKPEARAQLARVLQAAKEQPGLQVQVTGHTDGKGSDEYNMKLSQRRAESVVTYLAQNGIPRQSLKADWRGKREPVASNDTDAGRAQNRRVEILLTPVGAATNPCR